MKKVSICIAISFVQFLFAETKPVPILISGVSATASASSELSSKYAGLYSVKNLFDNDTTTAWVEGGAGYGIGEYVEVVFEKTIEIQGIWIRPGYLKSKKTFLENGVPYKINLKTEVGNIGDFTFNYNTEYNSSTNNYGARYCNQTATPMNLCTERMIVFNRPIIAKRIRMTILQALDGETKFSDLGITEFKPIIKTGQKFNKTEDSIAILVNNIFVNKSYVFKKADIFQNLKAIDLKSFLKINKNSVPISHAQVIRKQSMGKDGPVYDSVSYSNPERIPRVESKLDQDCFTCIEWPGFINTFIGIYKDKNYRYIIGDWTVEYLIESDIMLLMANFPVLVLKGWDVVGGFEVPVVLTEGECSHAPMIEQITKWVGK